MVSKQDGVSPRTASELELKHNFGKKFSEVMGYASDAQKAAEIAKEAADKATEAYEGLDQEAIFNLLTNNGEEQGIYRGENGQIYLNASYIMSGIIDAAVVQVVNLIANAVVSLNPDDKKESLEIGSAGLTLENGHGRSFVLRQGKAEDNTYLPFAKFTNLVPGEDWYQEGRYGATGFYVGGTDVAPALKVTAERSKDSTQGEVKVELPVYNTQITKELKTYWKPNDDGTYSMVGKA